MNLLYIASTEEIPGSNGGSVHVYEVSKELGKLGIGVIAITKKGDGKAPSAKNVSFVRIYAPALKIFFAPILLGYTFLCGLAASLIKRMDVYYERTYSLGGSGFLLSYIFGRPLILEANCEVIEEGIERGIIIRGRLLHRLLAWWLDLQFSRASAIITTSVGIIPRKHRHKAKIVTWAANTETFTPKNKGGNIRKKYGLEGKFVVLFSGSFRKWHGVGKIPEIAGLLRKNSDIVFLLVGDGELFESVKKEVSSRKLVNVILAGRQPYERMPDFVGCADTCIAPFEPAAFGPTRDFGFFWSPLKIFEYLAGGKPVVLSNIGKLSEELSKEGCAIIANTPREAASAIEKLAASPPRLARMQKKCRAIAEKRYNWTAHAELLKKIFKGYVRIRL